MVSAIIPALNESQTIKGVVTAALHHPSIDEVIVVDDGSTDGTADVAREAGARVIVNAVNLGKAAAMDVGVKAAQGNIILFLDADIVGHTQETLSEIIQPVKEGRYEMFVGIRSRKTFLLNKIMHFFPIIGGDRALTKTFWMSLPDTYKKGFMIETVLNHAAKKTPKNMGFKLIEGTTHVIKEKKYGLWKGLRARIRMIGHVIRASWVLYIWETIAEAFHTR